MALNHPVAIYTAGTNIEAYCVCEALLAAGIEAAVIEDESRVGAWMPLPQIHRPKVYVEQADAERALPVLVEFEERQADRDKDDFEGPPIFVLCEECRRTTTYSASKQGRVETCPICGAFVDVGDDPGFDDWNTPPDDEPA